MVATIMKIRVETGRKRGIAMGKHCEWKATKTSEHHRRTSCGKYAIVSFDSSYKEFPHEGEKCPDCGKIIKLVN
jgi:hypothetical protein